MNDHLFTPWSRTFSSCNTYLVFTFDFFWNSFQTSRLKYVYILRFVVRPVLVCTTHKTCVSKWFPNMFTETVIPEKYYKKSVGNILFCYPWKVSCKYDTVNRSMV